MKKITIVLNIILLGIFISNYADALCVNVPNANLRSGPGTNYGIAWEIYKYMPFQKVGVSLSGVWYAVRDVDGDVNWIHRSLLTSRYRCAVVKTEEVNVRTGPGIKYSKDGVAKKYSSSRVIRIKGKWAKVKDEYGSIGWIYHDYLWIQ